MFATENTLGPDSDWGASGRLRPIVDNPLLLEDAEKIRGWRAIRRFKITQEPSLQELSQFGHRPELENPVEFLEC